MPRNLPFEFYMRPRPVLPPVSNLPGIRGLFLPAGGGRLLDIGCFDGSQTAAVGRLIGAAEIYGVDFLPEPLAAAESRGVHTVRVDLNADLPLPFPDDFFDVVVCSEVLEHVFSPDEVLDEIARVLKPEGYAVITTPNLASWRNRVALVLGWQPFMTEVSTRRRYGNPLAPAGPPSGHLRLFTPRALFELTAACGLREEYFTGVALPSAPGRIVSSLAKWIDRLVVPWRPTLADQLAVRLRKAGA